MKYSPAEIAKAVAAFVAALGGMAAVLLADANFTNVVPANIIAILGSLVAAGVVAGVVFKVPNAITPEQAVKGAVKGGTNVINDIIDEAQKAGVPLPAPVNTGIDIAQQRISDALEHLPDLTSRTAVQDIVNSVLKR
ncbi:hypothetical protein Cali_241 [Mycobacterium phage Cali]|uniref:Holin n=44 Tax=Bixzunavirus TaxID=680114 RepID=Q852W8_BPMBZ|nr:holin [Mycobacterium phage Bxz1]YP_002224240.1 holin [Mycobacterium phage ScottMcG]YP_002224462.1 holin [Mycobacterium phage Spud]YP_002224683.1 holin [Mycobacterium phage Cali]YP_002224903.1 holin [Mycobacterium phage Rizal]YP_008061022.1 holin [Mycobacterium phage Gizmo]YP_008061479.1 holin [Mycobacterium phage ArcherS7]YP_008061711.1 holin [Mycobacterium phage Astraea]YP_009013000.1 holin [Mycobacterium phage Dandelion]YP_009014806.1 holin [Mycobacterium phage LinStu]YP_009017549.1 